MMNPALARLAELLHSADDRVVLAAVSRVLDRAGIDERRFVSIEDFTVDELDRAIPELEQLKDTA